MILAGSRIVAFTLQSGCPTVQKWPRRDDIQSLQIRNRGIKSKVHKDSFSTRGT